MKAFEIAIAFSTFATGMIAAWFWYLASNVPTDPGWDGNDRIEPVVHSLAQDQWIATMLQSATQSARFNKIAALWTAVSVLLTAVSAIASGFHA